MQEICRDVLLESLPSSLSSSILLTEGTEREAQDKTAKSPAWTATGQSYKLILQARGLIQKQIQAALDIKNRHVGSVDT
jgi:hypothetical protein